MTSKTHIHSAIKWALSGPDPRRQSLDLFSMYMGVRPGVWRVISNL